METETSLEKGRGPTRLAIVDDHQLAREGLSLWPRLRSDLVLRDEGRRPAGPQRVSHVEALTPRELEVLELTKLGCTNQQISRELGISLGTVKRHVENIITKLGVSNHVQAVVRALELKLLDLSQG